MMWLLSQTLTSLNFASNFDQVKWIASSSRQSYLGLLLAESNVGPILGIKVNTNEAANRVHEAANRKHDDVNNNDDDKPLDEDEDQLPHSATLHIMEVDE